MFSLDTVVSSVFNQPKIMNEILNFSCGFDQSYSGIHGISGVSRIEVYLIKHHFITKYFVIIVKILQYFQISFKHSTYLH